MSTYSASAVYLDDIKDLLDDNWVEFNDSPKPQLVIANDPLDASVRVNLQDGDTIIIRSEPEQIRYRGNIQYYDRIALVSLDMLTMKDRQRLHDMWKQVRVICFAKKHDFPNYQLIKMVNYQELMNEELNIWRGVARVQLENHAITVDSWA